MSFFALPFAIAGLIVAIGPFLIHMLNRRRFRVMEWAAMDFLRQALERNRKFLRLRDLLLLLLRTLVLILFGLAMARPYLSSSGVAADPDQPFHAVIIIDNSMSMGLENLEGRLIDKAKARARAFIERVPPGSRITLIPLCGTEIGISSDAYRSADDALEALGSINKTDRLGELRVALDLARDACQRELDMPAKRVIFIGDQQRSNWPQGNIEASLEGLPEVQVVQVQPSTRENTWISRFELRDAIADTSSPATFIVEVRHEGAEPRKGLEVSLIIDRVEVASQVIELQPGQTRELEFEFTLERPVDSGEVEHVMASVKIPADQLTSDDQAFLAVPVVSELPVVFVDSIGEDENPSEGRYGETFHLRRLLAPVISAEDSRGLIKIRHRSIRSLERTDLEDARLVIVAAIADPTSIKDWLMEYVEQGGRLVIAAGGKFDPRAWNDSAWADGKGFLPLPLSESFIGFVPDDTSREPEIFQLDPKTLTHSYYQLPSVSQEELADLFTLPYFFKATEVLEDVPIRAKLEEALVLETRFVQGTSNKQVQKEPRWLRWSPPELLFKGNDNNKDYLQRFLPSIRGRYDNGKAYLVERIVGQGKTLFISSGVYSKWNTFTRTYAVLAMDKILRSLISETFPHQTQSEVVDFQLPVRIEERRSRFQLTSPTGVVSEMMVEAFSQNQFGLTFRQLFAAGDYQVTVLDRDAFPSAQSNSNSDNSHLSRVREIPLAINVHTAESELTYLNEEAVTETSGGKLNWVGEDDSILIEGIGVGGEHLWKWLMSLALILLVVESLIILMAKPQAKAGAEA